jgi:hypothetical protein
MNAEDLAYKIAQDIEIITDCEYDEDKFYELIGRISKLQLMIFELFEIKSQEEN